jgi:hypothetical protein
MKRFSARIALGLAVMTVAPSIATAQIARATANTAAAQPRRGFSQISFGPAVPRTGPVSRPPGAFDNLLSTEGARLPEITAAPQPHPTPPPCVMRVVPVDPKFSSRMLVVNVDKWMDPKSVITLPECQTSK